MLDTENIILQLNLLHVYGQVFKGKKHFTLFPTANEKNSID